MRESLHLFRDWWRDLAEALLPTACAACGRPSHDALCVQCRSGLPGLPPDAPGPAPAPLAGWAMGAPFEGAWAVWIRRFKYPIPGLAGLDPAAEAVALELLLRAARVAPGGRPSAVVAVPQHPARLRARGFHPSGALAEALGRHHALPVLRRAVVRLRDTPSQTGLSRSGRRRNVAGAFGPGAEPLPRRIWLVDDVATTGHTLAATARAARAAGARRVVALCAAFTPSPSATSSDGERPPR